MKEKDQEQTWDNIAKSWDEYRKRIPISIENFLNEQKGEILDLGCGSGRNFLPSKNLNWYGIDFSKKMLNYAKEKDIAVELKKANCWELPYKDKNFDAVLCYAVLHCIDSRKNRQKTISEIYRVLKHGGRAFVSVWGRKSARLKNKEKECFIPWSSGLDSAEERYVYVYDKCELENELKKAGFKIVRGWEERNINFIVEK